jgi:RES domain-containing protein
VYLSDHPASALVEVLVHLEVDPEDLPNAYQLLAVDVADETTFESIETNDLPTDWTANLGKTRAVGDRWLADNQTALLRVPSAIVPFASNWLLNPMHADAAKAHTANVFRVPFDPRLVS